MDHFADEHAAADRNWREVDDGDHIVFIGTADNGRDFWVGYMKQSEK